MAQTYSPYAMPIPDEFPIGPGFDVRAEFEQTQSFMDCIEWSIQEREGFIRVHGNSGVGRYSSCLSRRDMNDSRDPRALLSESIRKIGHELEAEVEEATKTLNAWLSRQLTHRDKAICAGYEVHIDEGRWYVCADVSDKVSYTESWPCHDDKERDRAIAKLKCKLMGTTFKNMTLVELLHRETL